MRCVDGTQRESFETSEWNVTAKGTTTKLIIVYRPPNSETQSVPSSVFFQEFSHLENAVLCPEVLVISGDFNFHMDDPFDNEAKKFCDLIETFGLIRHVSFPTHISGHWLDLIIARSFNDIMVRSSHLSLFLSDHCFAECTLSIPSPLVTVKEVVYRR